VSASIVAAAAADFVFESRGMVDLKGKGATPTCFLVGRTPTG
jgi:hypothetical protein